ncbi:MAG: CRISPR-associated endonuclease Cas2 [Patescibacteria group bacterium]
MNVKSESITNLILEILGEWGRMVPRSFEGKYAWGRRLKSIHKPQFERAIRHLNDRGLVRVISKDSQRFVEITQAGQLEILLKKAKTKTVIPAVWDKKWRLVVFDIPEDSKDKRRLLRFLLKKQEFFKLQASVYISPFALNREAIAYLSETGLIDFIRIMRVDEMDNDRKLKNHFRLK